ncbi:hypothetical protein L565_1466 [Bordetella pertussis CHLA-20]|nr:hypothetical protein L565_1466 [Bordetella pertussis CHLA-20]ETH74427.1 hypothetical protein L555_1476 [Bordetella pertussis STO1-CHOC-0008]
MLRTKRLLGWEIDPARCEDSIGCMHGSSEPDLRNVPISRLNLDEYNLLTVHS